MTGKRIQIVLGVAMIVAASLACSFDFSTAKVENVRLARDRAGEDETTVFLPDETFYLVGDLENAPDDTVLTAIWTAVDVDGEDPNTRIGDKELETGSGEFNFRLDSEDLWPEGVYEVELRLDDDEAENLSFEVSADGRHHRLDEAADGADEDAGDEATADDEDAADGVSSGFVDNLDDVEAAVVQIVSQGSFISPEEGLQTDQVGSGSGFLIDPSGVAVTNNHVVTGAARIKVRVGGKGEWLRAKVLGVSECSDLAVIDIDGDGYPYLGWYDGEVKPGLDIYVAGFPLGEGEYTLTRGVVSQRHGDGQSSWASIDGEIVHDAVTNPGNSGGPVVTPDGQVVGIAYSARQSTHEQFAIGREEAEDIIERLRDGEDVTSLGINGQAVASDDVSGIWVSSVSSGSPADDAGIRGGDIVTRLEGLSLAGEGTMTEYCDVLRGHDPEDVLRVEVLRYADGQVLEGQINGRELEATTSVARAVEEEGVPAPGAGGGAGEGDEVEYVVVTDDTGSIMMKVPAAWDEIDGSAWYLDEEEVGVGITASSDIEEFLGGYGTAGVYFGASRSLAAEHDPDTLLDARQQGMGIGGCTAQGRDDYEDPFYSGRYEVYSNCGDDDAIIVAVAAMPEDGSFILYVLVQAVTEADLDAVDTILDTFQVKGELP